MAGVAIAALLAPSWGREEHSDGVARSKPHHKYLRYLRFLRGWVGGWELKTQN